MGELQSQSWSERTGVGVGGEALPCAYPFNRGLEHNLGLTGTRAGEKGLLGGLV